MSYSPPRAAPVPDASFPEAQARALRTHLVRSVLTVMAALVANQLLATATAAILARLMGSARLFGTLSLAQQAVGLVGLFLGLGLNSALVYRLARARTGAEEAGTVFHLALRATLAWSALLVALTVVLAPALAAWYREPSLSWAVAWGAVGLLGNAVQNLVLAVYTGEGDFRRRSAVAVAAAVAAAAAEVAAAAALRGSNLQPAGILLAGAVGTLAVTGLALVGAARARRWPLSLRGSWAGLGDLLRYGVPLWLGNLAKAYQLAYLVLVIGTVSVTQAGFAQVAVTLVGYPGLVTWAFRVVAVPLVAQGRSGEDRRVRALLCFRLSNYLLIPVVLTLVLARRALVVGLFGARYAGAAAYLPWLSVGMGCSAVSRLASDVLAGAGRTVEAMKAMVVGAFVLLLAAPALARGHPVAAAAAYAAGWALSAAQAWRLLRRADLAPSLRGAFGEPLLVGLPWGGALVSVGWRVPAWLALPSAVLLGLALLAWAEGLLPRGLSCKCNRNFTRKYPLRP